MQLELSEVTIAVGQRTLVDDLSIRVSRGHSLALVGPSGVGKSTLLACIAGFASVRQGSITLGSEGDKPAIEWLVQNSPMLSRRTALDNVMLARSIRFGVETDAVDRGTAMLSRLGLAHALHERVFRLSGGERQRVGVARALLSEPDVLLADEPTASLDPNSRDAVMEALLECADRGAILVLATHDFSVAQKCSDVLTLGANL